MTCPKCNGDAVRMENIDRHFCKVCQYVLFSSNTTRTTSKEDTMNEQEFLRIARNVQMLLEDIRAILYQSAGSPSWINLHELEEEPTANDLP